MGSKPVGIYSASGISAILGLNPYQTRLHSWQLIMEKLRPGFNAEKCYVLPEFPDNAPIRWGHAFEEAVIKLAEEKEGCEFYNKEELYTKSFGDITLTCHVDAKIRPGEYHEGKTTNTRAFYSVKGEDCDDETGEIEFKRRWGDPGTDQVPIEYTIQCAVQRICSGAELVKLSVLVFPKSTQDFEDLGWVIRNDVEQHGRDGEYWIKKSTETDHKFVNPLNWARTFAQIGNFHTYNLPKNEALESAIIKAVQEFDAKFVKTELPPPFEDYADVRRLVTAPMGTIIANDEMITLAREYSEIVRQVGDSGPMKKRQGVIKTIISNWMNTQRKSDWSVPNDKLILIDPNGGDSLISYSASGFRAKKA